jgi:Tfp pilus assembly protein PilF
MKRLFLLLLVTFSIACAGQASQPHSRGAHAARKSVSAAGGSADAIHLNNLGTAYMNQQQFKRALELFQRAAALDAKLEAPKLNQAIALLNLQQYGPSLSTLEKIVKTGSDKARAWYNIGLVYKNQGDPGKAVDAFQHAAQLAPDDPDVFYFSGVMLSQIGQQKEAIAAFQHALELNQFHASAEFGLSRALQRAGENDKAREHLARFQHLTQAKLGVPMSLVYGDQGKLSLAVQAGNAEQPTAATVRVRFADITREAGLEFSPPAGNVRQNHFGPGACFFDLDNDGRPDLFLADGGPQGGSALFRNLGNGKFEDITRKAGIDPQWHGIACAAADYDNDGHTDLALTTTEHVLLLHNEGDGTLKDVTDAVGIHMQSHSLSVTFVDYDHDGDLDLYVSSSDAGKSVLWRNNGNNTFTDVTAATGLAATAPAYGIFPTDFNNDRAIDLIFASDAKPQLFLNPREGQWNPTVLWATTELPPVVAAVALDFNKDGWMDVALAHDGAPGITLWRNQNGRSVEQVKLPLNGWQRAWGIAALDYDNDGWIDLAAVGETKDGRGEIRLFRNLGNEGFKDVSAEVGLDAVKLTSPRSLLAADVDGDGGVDLLITQAQAPAVLLHNNGGNQNHFLRISLAGLGDNKSAIGAKVEVFAGALWQKWEISGVGYLSQSSTDLLVGLGKERQIEIVRTLWPTGIVQDEAEFAANSVHKINEIDRRGSSCPLLFAWDGTHYRFIADMIGAGVVGHWVGPGERNVPDSTEYIKIEGEHLQPRNGLLSFRFMEPMEEVVYLDQARLLAIDHPRDLAVYPNERFLDNPPFPEFKVIASRNARPPAAAVDSLGNDVLELLSHRDRNYVTDFELLSYKGFTQPHTLEIELPSAYQGGPLRLLLYGYIEYFTANSMYAAYQAGIAPVSPYVEAQDAEGKWIRVLDDMGFPAGLPRTTVADLSGKVPIGAKRLRIATNLQIYWDQVLVDTTPETQPMKITDVPLAGARLALHGYPRAVEGKSPGDIQYTYEETSSTGPYAHEIGAYTRLGNVRDLVLDSDDRFVVFGSGEEVQLDFQPAALPSLPPGWKRDYFFFADGYEKDMDFYAAEGEFVDPLPFHAMSYYPYTKESYPQDDSHLQYLLDYNTRFVSEAPPASYDFHYPQRRQRAGIKAGHEAKARHD